MALIVFTAKPQALWNKLKASMKDDEVKTWELHTDGVHFTHASKQWAKRAWFKPEVAEGRLAFNIVKPKGKNITTEVYAEYHALLMRVLLARFDKHFSGALVTAMPATGDIVAVRD